MGAEEKSLKVYDTRRTFFSKIGSTLGKILTPTKLGFNNLLVSMKRSSMIKNYKNMINAKQGKEEVNEKKFEESYSLYLDSIDQLIMDSIYKKVKNGTATEFEKDALSNYYEVIHLKQTEYLEYKYKKQQYLLNLDYNDLKISGKEKQIAEYQTVYLYEMEQLYKALLKHYSIKLPEKMLPAQKETLYNKLFETLEEYVTNIIPLKKINDEELIKECSLFETYEVGKLDQVDILDKRMILLGISRKLFVHSLPLVVAERCYIKLLKDTRNLIVDTKIARKRENAYQLLLRMFEQYNQKLLAVKIYWNKNEEKINYNQFAIKCKELENVRKEQGLHAYDVRKQILYIREDMKYLERYDDKYYRILQFYRGRLVKLGDMKELKNICKTGNYKIVKGLKKVIVNEPAC